jgi:hypothetical protein
MANLTRILNNQIYSKTIIASQKIADGTITGSLFSSNVTVPGDFLITGNLFVLGSSQTTTVASTNTYVNDPLIVMNNGYASTNTYDEGLVFNRGTLLNQAFIWSEFNQEFRLIGTTETGTTYGNVAVSTYANLHIGNLNVAYAANVGAITAPSLNVSGNVLASTIMASYYTGSTATFGNIAAVTIGNVGTQFNGAAINLSGNVLASTIMASYYTGSTATFGNIAAVNFGNVGAIFTGASLNVSGNVLASTVGASYITASTATFGNISANTIGNASATLNGGFLNVSGNVLASTIMASYYTGSTATFGNIAAVNFGNTGATYTGASINLSGNVLAAGGVYNALTVNGNETVTGYLNVTGNILAATGTLSILGVNNNLWANASIATTTQGTGAIVVPNGGISVAGAANIALTATVGGATQINNTLAVGGITTITNTTQATTASTGALQVAGGASIAQDLWVGGNLFVSNIIGVQTNIITVQDPLLYLRPNVTTPYNYDIGFYSAFTGTGLGTVNQYQHTSVFRDPLTNTWTFASNLAEPSPSYITLDATTIYDPIKAGNLQLTVTTDSTNATTGALIVAGGAGIGGNIFQTGTRHETSASNFLLATTPTTVDAFKAATTLNVGANSGTFTIGNPTVVGTQATQNLYNTTSTTLNFAGAATALTMGATTGNTTINNSLGLNGVLFANLASDTSSTTTGAIIVPNGGLSVSGNAYVGKNLYIGGASAFNVNLTTPTIVAVHAGSTYAQMAMINNTLTGSSDFIAYPGDYPGQGNDHGWMDMGFTGTAFNDANYTITKPQDGYLFASAANTSVGGNLVLATDRTGNFNDIVFGVGSFIATSEVARFHGNVGSLGNLWIKYPTTSTTYTSGALRIDGGIGAAGNINIVGDNTGAVYSGRGAITVGLNLTNTLYPENLAQFTSNANSFSRISIQNISTQQNATSEFIAIANNGSNVSNYISTGIAGINFNSAATVSIIKPNDGYTYATGNLVLFGSNDLILSAGGATQVFARVSSAFSNIGIQTTTPATSSTTGALTTVGGVGVGTNLYVGKGATINSTNGVESFKVLSSFSSNVAIYANTAPTGGNAGPTGSFTETVIIGGGNLQVQPGAILKVGGATSMIIPVGPSAARPSSQGGNDVAGMIRFNSTTNVLEYYDGSAWQVAGSSFTVISDRQYSGNSAGSFGNVDGTNTVYTIQSNATTASTLVSINGVIQFPVLAYSVSGTTLTFTEPPAPGDVIDVRVLTTTASVTQLASGNGLNQFIADATGSSIWSGTSTTFKRVLVDPAGNINYLTGNKVTYDQTKVNIPSAASPVVVDTFYQSAYSTAKYIISTKKDAVTFESMEALLITDGAGNAYVTTYAIVNNGTALGTLSANVVGANVNLYYTSTSATNANVKVMTTYIV